MKSVLCLLVATGVAVLAGAVSAETPEEKGLAIIVEADKRDLGWGDSESTMRMVLRNKQGQESTRELRQAAMEVPEKGLGDRGLTIFDSPKDVEGTALLSHTKVLEPDDQWLFLPALKRVKRISSKNKSGPFVGSEFAYEDLLSQEVEKYKYKWLRDEACGDLQCFVVEAYPQYENSGYTRQIVWLDKDEYRAQKIDYYDRKDAQLKTLTYHGYQEYLGQYWRPAELRMVNHQTGKSTELYFGNWKFQTGQQEAKFTPARLKRAR